MCLPRVVRVFMCLPRVARVFAHVLDVRGARNRGMTRGERGDSYVDYGQMLAGERLERQRRVYSSVQGGFMTMG